MPVTIELNEKLAEMAGGVSRLEVQGPTLQDAVIAFAKIHRQAAARIFNCEGSLRSVVKVEVNGQPVSAEKARETELHDGDTVRLTFP